MTPFKGNVQNRKWMSGHQQVGFLLELGKHFATRQRRWVRNLTPTLNATDWTLNCEFHLLKNKENRN